MRSWHKPAAAAVLTSVALAACGGPQPVQVEQFDAGPAPPPTPQETCDGVELRAREVWSKEIKARLDLQVKVYEDDIDASDAEKTVAWMDVFSRGWIRAGEATCKDLFIGQTITREEYDRRFECLDRVLEGQRSVVELLKSAGPEAVDRIKKLVAELEGCVPVDAGRPKIRENPF
jgi:hypothetical protein